MNCLFRKNAELSYEMMSLLLCEYQELGMPLKRWNLAQKSAWMRLVTKNAVRPDDVSKFYRFAAGFRSFYEHNHRLPTAAEAARLV